MHMLAAKQVADFLTILRGFLAIALVWLGFSQGSEGLTLAAWMLIAAWTSDSLDGPLARNSRVRYSTWVGDHDLVIDMAVAFGLIIFMVTAGMVDLAVAIVYLLVWSLIFLYWGVPKVFGMLAQAPIYGWFIWMALHNAPVSGWCIIAWILITLVLTWPKFPREMLPGFLGGMSDVLRRDRGGSGEM
jgi:cardiolipin synthase